MVVSITETKLLPVRRDKQISASTVTGGGGGGISEYGTSQSFYDVGVSGFTDGTELKPSVFFSGDTNTGFFRPLNNCIGVAVNGNEEFRFQSNGDFYASADVVGFSTVVSDKRLKDNIEPIKDGLNIIQHLQGIKYNYKVNNTPHFGFIAQDIQKVLPEIVIEHSLLNDDKTKYLTIRYSEIIPWLVEAIKIQQKQIHQLELDLNFYKNYNT